MRRQLAVVLFCQIAALVCLGRARPHGGSSDGLPLLLHTRRGARSHARGLVPVSLGSAEGQDDANRRISSALKTHTDVHPSADSCFPAVGFNMPDRVPSFLQGWWCSPDNEYAFMGFSYEVSTCQSRKQLTAEFSDARRSFHSRYIRIYGACDTEDYYDDIIDAAWSAGVGVQALIWFGFDGDDKWKTRRDDLVRIIKTNPRAPYVIRGIQFGSEPLFDQVLPPRTLAKEVRALQKSVHPFGINVTVSDLVYGFQSQMSDGTQDVLDAVDFVDLHMLPYFAKNASAGQHGLANNIEDQTYIEKRVGRKKVYWSENGWPSEHDCPGVCPNSPKAISDVRNEKAYFDTLDDRCGYFRDHSIGWFAHIYSDSQEPGYGIYDRQMKLKFDFSPRIKCETDEEDSSEDSESQQHPSHPASRQPCPACSGHRRHPRNRSQRRRRHEGED